MSQILPKLGRVKSIFLNSLLSKSYTSGHFRPEKYFLVSGQARPERI